MPLMAKHRRPLATRLCLVWLAIIPLVTLWEVVSYSGLYRWLCEWQLSYGGSYEAGLTAVILCLFLVAPAAITLGWHARIAPRPPLRPVDPGTARRSVSRVLATLGSLSAAVAAAAWLWSQQLPDRSDPPVSIDVARLGAARPSLGSAVLIGRLDLSRAVSKVTGHNSNPRRTFYIPVLGTREEGQPVRFLVDARTGSHRLDAGFGPGRGGMRGVLVENGLPGDMERMFARMNVPLSAPYYLLITGADGVRLDYYVAATLSGSLALLSFGFLAIVGLSKTAPGKGSR